MREASWSELVLRAHRELGAHVKPVELRGVYEAVRGTVPEKAAAKTFTCLSSAKGRSLGRGGTCTML